MTQELQETRKVGGTEEAARAGIGLVHRNGADDVAKPMGIGEDRKGPVP